MVNYVAFLKASKNEENPLLDEAVLKQLLEYLLLHYNTIFEKNRELLDITRDEIIQFIQPNESGRLDEITFTAYDKITQNYLAMQHEKLGLIIGYISAIETLKTSKSMVDKELSRLDSENETLTTRIKTLQGGRNKINSELAAENCALKAANEGLMKELEEIAAKINTQKSTKDTESTRLQEAFQIKEAALKDEIERYRSLYESELQFNREQMQEKTKLAIEPAEKTINLPLTQYDQLLNDQKRLKQILQDQEEEAQSKNRAKEKGDSAIDESKPLSDELEASMAKRSFDIEEATKAPTRRGFKLFYKQESSSPTSDSGDDSEEEITTESSIDRKKADQQDGAARPQSTTKSEDKAITSSQLSSTELTLIFAQRFTLEKEIKKTLCINKNLKKAKINFLKGLVELTQDHNLSVKAALMKLKTDGGGVNYDKAIKGQQSKRTLKLIQLIEGAHDNDPEENSTDHPPGVRP